MLKSLRREALLLGEWFQVLHNGTQSFEALGGHAPNDTSYPRKLECWVGMIGIHRLVQTVRRVFTVAEVFTQLGKISTFW
jgi:hypothetical protein